jgi:hypothetical protein
MSDPAKSIEQNILPVQALFNVDKTFNTFIGQGQPFTATISPDQSGLNITSSTINSTTIGATTPSSAAFTTATVSTAPVGGNDVVNKTYLDYFAAGLSWKQPVLCATTANITLTGLQTLDGVTVVAGDRVLVKNQSTASQNGIYLASATAWSRAPDADVWTDLISAITFVETGSTLSGTAWYCTAQPGGTIGTTAVTWSNFSVASSYTAGTGLTLAGNAFSITNTGVTAGAYVSASKTLTATVNAQGQLPVLAASDIAIANTQVSGLGTMSTQNANSVAITGGTLNGVTIGGTTAGAITGTTITATTFNGAGTGLTGTASALSIGGSAGSATTATTATNLANGAAGSVPYQTASGVTAMLATGTGVLVGGTTPSYSTAPTLTGTNFSSIPNGALTNSSITLGSTAVSLGATASSVTALSLANATVSNYENFTGTTAPSYLEGRVWYDSTAKTLSYYNDVSSAVVHVGQDTLFKVINNTGSTIANGSAVYITSTSSGQTYPNVALAQANAVGTSAVIGLTNGAIANGAVGYVTAQGGIDNVNTSAFTVGQILYLSPYSAGQYMNTVPPTGYVVQVGTVSYIDSSAGKIFVKQITPLAVSAGILVGTVAIANGGTNGTSTPVAGAVPYGTGTAYAFTAAGTSGQVLQSNGASAPTWVTPAAYATVTDDTTTNATRYPLFAAVTTGNLTTEYVSSTRLKFNPSTGALTANQLIIAP